MSNMMRRLSKIKYIIWETYPNVFDFTIDKLTNEREELNVIGRFRTSPLGDFKTFKMRIDDEGHDMQEDKK